MKKAAHCCAALCHFRIAPGHGPGAEPPGSDQNDINGGFAAITAGFDVEGDLLVILQAGVARPLDCGDVDENVLAAALGGDKAETLGAVEPFHGAIGHRDISLM